MEIRFQGRLDQDTMARAVRAGAGRRFWSLAALAIAWAAVLAMLAARADDPDRIVLAAMALSAVGIVFLVRRRLGRVAEEALRAPKFQGLRTGRADEHGIELHSPVNDSHHRWEAFTAYRVTPVAVQLSESSVSSITVARSFFASDADWEAFCHLVARRVGPGSGGADRREAAVPTSDGEADDQPPFAPLADGSSRPAPHEETGRPADRRLR
jgi:hypothetical protein